MSSISCRNLCRTFHQGDEVITGLDHVDLDIEEGEFVCLSGPSGSGKTTLLNAMGGLDTPDEGEITVGKYRVDKLSKSKRGLAVRNIANTLGLRPRSVIGWSAMTGEGLDKLWRGVIRLTGVGRPVVPDDGARGRDGGTRSE